MPAVKAGEPLTTSTTVPSGLTQAPSERLKSSVELVFASVARNSFGVSS